MIIRDNRTPRIFFSPNKLNRIQWVSEMASAVLTDEQKSTCLDLGCAMVFAGVSPGYEACEVDPVPFSFLQILGASRTTDCVSISRIPISAIDDGLSQWWIPLQPVAPLEPGEQPEYRPASLLEKGRGKLAFEFCCQVAGNAVAPQTQAPAPPVPQPNANESALATQVLQEQLLVLQAMQAQIDQSRAQVPPPPAPPTHAGQALPPPVAATRRIKLKEIIDEFNEDECGLISDVELARCYAVYEAVYGRDERPEEEEELTHEQISALSFLLKQGSINVNFNVFGPHGHRTIRRVKLQGQFFHQDGTLHRVELLGPATFEMWLASWSVFQHGLMMLEAVELGRLTAYRKHQERMHRRYGSNLWPLQFQVEKRTRDELFPRLKRDGYAAYLKKKSDVETAGGTWDKSMHPYDPEKPWDYVFWKVMHETNANWWMQQFEIPALRIPQTHKRVADFLEGDAPIAASAGPSGSNVTTVAIADPFGHSGPPPPPPHAEPRRKRPRGSEHNVVDGHWAHL